MTPVAVAVEVLDAGKNPIVGVIGKLGTKDGSQLYVTIANQNGYDIFNQVQSPFVGVLKLTCGVQYYEQPISIAEGAVNVTLRVGGVKSNPDDIVLPPAVPSF